MIFEITYNSGKTMRIKAESWLDLLKSLSNDVVKIEVDKENEE